MRGHIFKWIKRASLILIVLILFSESLKAQAYFTRSLTAYNAVYIEAAGNGLIATLNYENVFFQSEYINVSWRLGGVYMPLNLINGDENFLLLLLGVNEFIGLKDKYLEIGFHSGFTHNFPSIYKDISGQTFIFSGNIGYRNQRHDRGRVFKIGFTPFFYPELIPYVGASYGFSF